MNVRSALAVGGLTVVGVLAVAGPAAAVCDAYSGTCLEEPVEVDPTVLTTPQDITRDDPADPGSTTSTTGTTRGSVAPATLPFTGGELVLASAAGAAAVAAGAGLVVAGRRRTGAPAA